VDAPKGYRGEIKPLDKEQVTTLLATAKETQPRLFALYTLAITAGLRQSELIGLQWGDLDLHNGRLTVKRSVFKGKINAPKTAIKDNEVNTNSFLTDAPLPKLLVVDHQPKRNQY
jgi:integrase